MQTQRSTSLHSNFNMAMKRFMIFLTIVSIVLVQNINGSPPQNGNEKFPHVTSRYEVIIFNLLPQRNSKLITHCYSGDDDFGNHTLYVNQKQKWSFYANIFKTTRFICSFWWGRKRGSINVFYAKNAHMCETGFANVCGWLVKEDGFYFSPNEQYKLGSTKMYNWNG